PSAFQEILGEHDRDQMAPGHSAVERDEVEDHRVDQLAAKRRAYDPGPEPAASSPDLHFRQYVAVDEGTAEERGDGGDHDARRVAEYRFHRRLNRARVLRRRKVHDHG